MTHQNKSSSGLSPHIKVGSETPFNMQRYGNSPIVTLNVGNPAKAFRIHRNLLCDASPVFKAAFLGTFQESERQAMDLEEEDDSNFEVIAHWLYTKTCVITAENEPDDTLYMHRLATYKRWPHEELPPGSFADTGFIHEPEDYPAGFDKVRCDHCSQTFGDWKPGEDPVLGHLEYSPDCLFAQQAHEALIPIKENDGEAHFSEAYFLRLAEVYAVAETYEITELKNTLIDLVFRLKRASPKPKPPTSTVLTYVYNTTPTNSPLRRLLVAWYTWHVYATWYDTEDCLETLYEVPEFAAELACSNGRKMSGLIKSSPLYGKSEAYHEGVPCPDKM